MNISDWIALGALAVATVGPIVAQYHAGGKREGRLDAILEHLTSITTDHEDRLRTLEHVRQPGSE